MFFERQKSSESSEKKRKKFRKIRQYVFERKTSSESSDKKFRKFGEKVQTKCFWKAKKFREFRKKKFRKFREKKGSESFRKKFVFLVQKVFRQHSSNKLQKNKKKANLIQKNICRRLKSKIKWYCEDGFLILRYTFTYNLLITCLQPLLLEIKLCNFLAKVRWNIYFPTFVTFCYVCNFFLTFVTFW